MITTVASVAYVIYLMVSASLTADARRFLATRSAFMLSMLSCPACSAFWASLFVMVAPKRLRDILGYAGLAALVWHIPNLIEDTREARYDYS